MSSFVSSFSVVGVALLSLEAGVKSVLSFGELNLDVFEPPAALEALEALTVEGDV